MQWVFTVQNFFSKKFGYIQQTQVFSSFASEILLYSINQLVDRARMLLRKSEAKTDKAIADGFGISVNTVRCCIDRYFNSGINLAVFDDESFDHPVEITDEAKSWIVTITYKSPVIMAMSLNYGHWQHYTNTYRHMLKRGYLRLKTVTKSWLQRFDSYYFV